MISWTTLHFAFGLRLGGIECHRERNAGKECSVRTEMPNLIASFYILISLSVLSLFPPYTVRGRPISTWNVVVAVAYVGRTTCGWQSSL